MTRDPLEQVVRAAAARTNKRFLVVIGESLCHRGKGLGTDAPDPHHLGMFERVAGRANEARFFAVTLKEKMIPFRTLEPLIRQLESTRPIEAIVAWARRRAQEAAP